VTQWRGRNVEALKQLQERLQEDFHQPALWTSYANALANVPDATPEQLDLAMRISEQPTGDDPEAVPLLSRLAWVLYCAGQRKHQSQLLDRAGAIAERAAALQPQQAEPRRELAGVLAALGKTQSARSLVAGLPNEECDRPLRISLLVAEHRLDEAETELRRLVEQKPADTEAR
jgi:predicted Zn-dependent protease